MADQALYFITGASRGLGEALARLALAEGAHVVGLARSAAAIKDPSYRQETMDLADLSQLEHARTLFAELARGSFREIHLVNNAGMIEPVGSTGGLNAGLIVPNYTVNLLAPVILTNLFLQAFGAHPAVKIITNVTSGVARQPKATWAVYSSAKAGLNAFSRALADEHAGDTRVKVVCFEPGIIDTEMQAEIRSIPKERFPDLDRFVDFKKTGALATPEKVARALMKIHRSPTLGQEIFRSVSEA